MSTAPAVARRHGCSTPGLDAVLPLRGCPWRVRRELLALGIDPQAGSALARPCSCARTADPLVRRCTPRPGRVGPRWPRWPRRQRHLAGKQRPNRHPHHGPAAHAGGHPCGADARECQKQTGRGELSRGAGHQSEDTGPGGLRLPLATRAKSIPEIPICPRRTSTLNTGSLPRSVLKPIMAPWSRRLCKCLTDHDRTLDNP
jgi:hypothetical protein